MAKLVAVDDIPKGARLVAVEDESVPLGQQLNAEIASIPRQLGLTARAGIEGLGDVADFVSTPVRAGLNALGGNFKPGIGSMLADKVGLPKPESTMEKVANTGARMMVPAAGFIKGGEALQKGGEVAQGVGKLLAANPGLQLASSASGGVSGEYVKQTGGDDVSQLVASLAGGIAAPTAINAVSRVPQAVMNGSKRFVEAVAPGITKQSEAPQINVVINNALRDSGITLDQLPANIAASLRADVAQAMQQGTNLSSDAVRRLADYRLTGATPRAANLTLDPVALTQQKNLAKLGANSNDPAAQLLARAENENNTTLISRLNELGGNGGDRYGSALPVIDRLSAVDDSARDVIGRLYDKARNTSGRSASLDPSFFTNRVDELISYNQLNGALPEGPRVTLNKIATGEMPLTVDVAEQLKTAWGKLQRGTNEGNVKTALSMARQALDETPLMGNQGQQAIDAFNRARRANARYMNLVERTPALQAVRDGVEPDKFVNQYIIGTGDGSSVMSVAQLRNVTRGSKEATNAIRGSIIDHLKTKALSGASDEVGKISQSALNKAINEIGERKLKLFFSPEELNQLKAIGRVASYEQVQPAGSAVNNSNTAGTAIATILDKIGSSPLLSKIPLGRVIAEPAQNIAVGLKSKNAVNIPASLVIPNKKKPLMVGVSPSLGLLGFSE